MEKSHIHLFTSNHLEGWGAVVNEAMNSGCAVVANREAGAVPYLIEHGKEIARKCDLVMEVRSSWGTPVPVWKPMFSQEKGLSPVK